MSDVTPTRTELPRVFLLTLGCPKNEVDSDFMRADLAARGFVLAQDLDDADSVIVNTCGFIRDAVEESIEVILELEEWRDAVPGRRLVVAGCLVSRYGDELSEAMPEIDEFVPVAEEGSIAQAVAGGPLPLEAHRVADTTPARLDSGPSAYLQISDGCHRSCAYCTIPSIRGPYRSRPLDDLIAEAELLVSRGARELVLIGQDISSYGRDSAEGVDLPAVIRAVAAIERLRWIRLMYVQPDGLTESLVSVIAEEPKVCRYLDIPLQHASRSILRSMRRSGSADEFLGMIDRLRARIPDIALRTTFIAGYPGETSENARELEHFVERARFDYVAVFPYSPEEGTAAARLPGLPDRRTRIRRAQRLRDIADKVAWERASERVGSIVEVMSEGLDEDGAPVGRWRGQAPEVDGIVVLDRNVRVGTFVNVRLTDSICYDLEGRVQE